MYRCENCGRTFDDPTMYYEDDTGYRSYTCPHCGCPDYVEVNACAICGEATEGEYDAYCPECMDDYDRYVVSVIKEKIGADPESVVASCLEGFPKVGDTCRYCSGGNCDVCEDVMDSIVDLFFRQGYSMDDFVGMSEQMFEW